MSCSSRHTLRLSARHERTGANPVHVVAGERRVLPVVWPKVRLARSLAIILAAFEQATGHDSCNDGGRIRIGAATTGRLVRSSGPAPT